MNSACMFSRRLFPVFSIQWIVSSLPPLAQMPLLSFA